MFRPEAGDLLPGISNESKLFVLKLELSLAAFPSLELSSHDVTSREKKLTFFFCSS